jgi:hypothetical protein
LNTFTKRSIVFLLASMVLGCGNRESQTPIATEPQTPIPEPQTPITEPSPQPSITAGDRLSTLATGAQFPESAFVHANGGNPQSVLIDVTQLRRSLQVLGYSKWTSVRDATPNDPRDDDALAISDALNFLLDTLIATSNAEAEWQPKHPYSLYLPAGVYHVASQIAYRDFDIDSEITNAEVRAKVGRAGRRDAWDPRRPYKKWSRMRIIGQVRGLLPGEGTEIRLIDNAPDFDDATRPRAVLSYTQNADFNNAPAGTRLENLRIHIGNGNPGAIGVDWFGANNSRMLNVSIQSSAPVAVTGLRIPAGPTLGLLSDLSIDGFQTAVQIDPVIATNPTIEHLSIGPNVTTGIEVNLSTPTFRRVYSRTRGSALKLSGMSAHVVLIDSDLRKLNHSNADAAIQNNAQPLGAVFARNVQLAGYVQSYRSASLSIPSKGRIDEFVSKLMDVDEPELPALAQSNSTTRSLNLPIRDVPMRPPVTPDKWIRVEDYRDAGASDGQAVTRAFAVAAATPEASVLFERAAYRFDAPVNVPASVEMIYMSSASISTASNVPNSGEPRSAFVVTEPSSKALHILEGDGVGSPLVRFGSTRDLVLDGTNTPYFASTAAVADGAPALGDVFLVSANAYGRGTLSEFDMKAPQRRQRIFARAINTEFKGDYNFRVNPGGTLVVLGYKVEGSSRNFRVENGGTLEVLGGVMNEPFLTEESKHELLPGIDNDGGSVSLVFNTSTHKGEGGAMVGHDIIIRDANLAAGQQDLDRTRFPKRADTKGRPMLIVPLYQSQPTSD